MSLIICGSIAWDFIGRTKKPQQDYPTPVIYTPAANISISQIITHCTSCHSVIIDDSGSAYTFGRNEKGQLGDSSFKSRSNPFKIPLNDSVVAAATGRNHTLLVTKSGSVYSAGENKCLQLGQTTPKDSSSFTLIPDLKEQHITKVACGADFSFAITDKGKVWSWGNPQYGQLGHGSDQQHIAKANKIVFEPQAPKMIARLAEKNIIDIKCGTNHTLALDDTGAIYVWGCAGYGRLGLNESPPRDVMIPTEVSGFKNRNNLVKKIASGPTCCMVTDARDGLYLWGKWKNSGDGGQGSPYLYPKYFDGLSGWKIDAISCGGVSLFALSEKSTISWGQNASNGELGHGEGKPRSATNAVKLDSLDDVNVKDVSCGQGHTLLLVDSEDEILKTIGKSEGTPVDYSKESPVKKRKNEDGDKPEKKKK